MAACALRAFIENVLELRHLLDALEGRCVPRLRHHEIAVAPSLFVVAGENVLNFAERQAPEVLTVPADDAYPVLLQRKPIYSAFAFGGFALP